MKRPVLVAAALLLAAWVVTSLVRDPHSPRSAEGVAVGADSHAGAEEVDADPLAAPTAVASSRAEATQRSTPGREELVVHVENDLGEPLAGADVRVTAVAPDPLIGVTGTDGRARFELPTGWSEARVRAAWRGTADGPELFGSVRFTPPLEGSPVRVVLMRNGRVSGIVIAEDGAPAAAARVRLDGVDDAEDPMEADGDGGFRLVGVRPGERTVTAESYGLVARATVDVPPGGEATGVELRFGAGGWIEGRMLTADGAGAVDRPVYVSPDGDGDRNVRTGGSGRFRMGPLAPGEYEAYGFLAGELPGDDIELLMSSLVSAPAYVKAGETTQLTLQPPSDPRPHLSGLVLRDGEPLGDAFVLAVREARSYMAGPRSGTTDAEGRFDIELSGPGRHLVLVYPAGALDASLRCSLEVPAEGLADVTLEHPTGAIVLEFEEGAPPMTRAELEPLDATLSIPQLKGARRLLQIDDPTPRFRHLAAGGYRLTVFIEELASGPYELEVAEGEVVRFPVTFERGGTLRVAFDPAAAPLPDLTLVVINQEGRPLGRTGPYHDPSDGPWTSPTLPRGSWCVLGATSDGRTGATTWAAVTRDTVTHLQMPFQEGARLTCVARRGEEAVPASFRLYDAEGREVSSLFAPRHGVELVPMRSDEGHFGPLLPGRYRAVAKSAEGESVERTVTLAAGESVTVVIGFPSGD